MPIQYNINSRKLSISNRLQQFERKNKPELVHSLSQLGFKTTFRVIHLGANKLFFCS